ncbi:MAG TPA: hypothetical protein GX497_07535 [Bacillus bacterium]|nr:hypothetical protein [Bacillus sp. (in: firmicutes)]
MKQVRLKYENVEYGSLEEMASALLNEVNEQIVRMDLGDIQNSREERNYAKFRLMHLERSFQGEIHEQYRSIYNSLWSQLYRLEHQCNDANPLLKILIERLRARDV